MKYQAIDSDYIREMKERDEFLRQKGWLMKGMKYGYFTAIIIIILSAFFSGNLVLAIGEVDINYEFESDELYNETDIFEATNFNIRNQTEYTGHYNATYSFENDTGLIGVQIPFIDIDTSGSNTGVRVIDSWENHNEVLEFYDNSSTEDLQVNHDFGAIYSDGTYEFWWGASDIGGKYLIMQYRENTDLRVSIKYQSGNFYNYDGGFNAIKSGCTVNTWYHHKLIFNDALNSFDWYINGVLEGDDLNYYANTTIGFDNNNWVTATAPEFYNHYFDAIGEDWDKTHYDNEFFDISSEDDWGTGITWDGTHFWVIGQGGQNAYQYTNAGVYTTVNFHYGTQDIYGNGITWDGTHFWIVGSFSDTVYQYTNAGIYTGFSFSVLSELTHPNGITWDGTYFWIVGSDNDAVFKYNSTGNYTSDTFSVVSQDNNPSDIAWNGIYLYVLGYQNTRVFEYTTMGVYTGYYFDVSNEGNAHEGLVYAIDSFWTTEVVFDNAFKYLYVENPYNIGDNLIPYSLTNTSIQETNAYEFSFTEAGIYTESETTPPFWTEIESSTYVQDGYFKIFDDTSATTDLGLYKDDFSITSGIIDVSMVFEYEHSSTSEAVFYLKLFSADATEIVRLRMYSHLFDANTINTLSYWNGTTYNNITTLVKDVIYSINVFINGRMVILSLDGVQIAIFETLADKNGLSEVRFNGNGGQYGDGVGQNRYVEFKIYSIGIYSGGISVSNDYYSSFFSTTLDWDSNVYNFFTADIVGNCSIVVGSTVAIGSPHTLFAYREFSGVEMKNVYDEFTGGNEVEGWVALQDFNLTITSNTTIILNSMVISGFKLTEGLNTYYMDLTFSGIDIDNSYFYVLGGNLYFSLTTDDSNLEYIEATFVIPNLPSFERGLDWSGVKSGSSLEAQFKVNYVDSSFNPFTLEPAYKDLAVLLPQDKTITSFSLLISDNDNDVNDTITGFIGSFELIYIPLIETDFISISFFDALPIVVLVVVIPIALYVGFGRKKELLVPSIMAMSIFGTAIGLIPLWLTFVIGFGCVSYYIIDKRN